MYNHEDVYMMERLEPETLRPRWLTSAARQSTARSSLLSIEVDTPLTPLEDELPDLEASLHNDLEQTPISSPTTPHFRFGFDQPIPLVVDDMPSPSDKAMIGQVKGVTFRPAFSKTPLLRDLQIPNADQRTHKMEKMIRQSKTEEQLHQRIDEFVRSH